MGKVLPDEIEVGGEAFALSVERKQVKNVNARLRGCTIFVSAPPHMVEEDLKPIVEDLARKLARQAHSGRVNSEEDAMALIGKVARRFGEPPQVERALFVTDQRARWGSYSSRTRTIRLNAALRHMPGWVLEAVIAHELTHAVYLDHSPEFWSLLREVCPETDRAEAFLAGVSWLGHNWERLPSAQKDLLTRGIRS